MYSKYSRTAVLVYSIYAKRRTNVFDCFSLVYQVFLVYTKVRKPGKPVNQVNLVNLGKNVETRGRETKLKF
jgi:hypothetical protein